MIRSRSALPIVLVVRPLSRARASTRQGRKNLSAFTPWSYRPNQISRFSGVLPSQNHGTARERIVALGVGEWNLGYELTRTAVNAVGRYKSVSLFEKEKERMTRDAIRTRSREADSPGREGRRRKAIITRRLNVRACVGADRVRLIRKDHRGCSLFLSYSSASLPPLRPFPSPHATQQTDEAGPLTPV